MLSVIMSNSNDFCLISDDEKLALDSSQSEEEKPKKPNPPSPGSYTAEEAMESPEPLPLKNRVNYFDSPNFHQSESVDRASHTSESVERASRILESVAKSSRSSESVGMASRSSEPVGRASRSSESACAAASTQDSVCEASNELLPRKASVANIKKGFTLKKNIKEKIIICLDLATEMSSRFFLMGDRSEVSILNLVKKVIVIFIHNKIGISDKHEFALAILHDGAMFLSEFTSDPANIVHELNDITETMPSQVFEMSSLFEMIQEKLVLPDDEDLEPPYLIRAILIYGRSNIVPTFTDNELQKKFRLSKYFFLDVLYVHDVPSDENNCKEIHERFIEFDVWSKNYIFEVSRNPTKLHNCMAMLLGHPLQRCPQSEANYKIK